MKLTRFEDLECWEEARSLVRTVYAVTRNGAFKKDLRLSAQIQGAATGGRATLLRLEEVTLDFGEEIGDHRTLRGYNPIPQMLMVGK